MEFVNEENGSIEYGTAYNEPDLVVDDEYFFNIDYYNSHYVPTREIIELRRANDE